ncbi:hypothetical protein M8744_08410 [Lutimaribacter sp. EGI FJ00013]|uniref:Uncharacterized protein n=1 Tax=Lutimaribacter degradans TaxID=2945989 RepID=A0ACC5ZVR9_9RHOB|nr:hypothetical protein [Lutimaribacter sp. EGI FJ00013]MCM2562167.1 hypothetical protein [Lutimaribacter sp. EGI FJ00013]
MTDAEAGRCHRHLVDLQDVTGIALDHPGLLHMQARKADFLGTGGAETLMAYFATTHETIKLACMVQRSWDGLRGVVARIFDDEAQALSFLGVAGLNMARLRAVAPG